MRMYVGAWLPVPSLSGFCVSPIAANLWVNERLSYAQYVS